MAPEFKTAVCLLQTDRQAADYTFMSEVSVRCLSNS